VLRRHRLVETFLVNVLGLAPDRVHAEAHRLEHALSDEVVERLDRWLGRPHLDPHGSPIPPAARAPRMKAKADSRARER
jgi:DtxR family Mn-dependent transcriptional regulator